MLKRADGVLGEDLVSKSSIQDETSNGRQDTGTGGPALSPSSSTSAVCRRRRVAADWCFRSRGPAAILPSRERRLCRCVRVVSVVAGVSRAEQHGTAGVRRRPGVSRQNHANLVTEHTLHGSTDVDDSMLLL